MGLCIYKRVCMVYMGVVRQVYVVYDLCMVCLWCIIFHHQLTTELGQNILQRSGVVVIARLDEDLRQMAADVVSGDLAVQKPTLNGLGVVLERPLVTRLAVTAIASMAALLEGGMREGGFLAGRSFGFNDGQVVHTEDVIEVIFAI
ncbi:hypothetical protein EON63_13240 [archaeon]|nr:MAG: hypothetical protein EON63_13240 [archaeon]